VVRAVAGAVLFRRVGLGRDFRFCHSKLLGRPRRGGPRLAGVRG
jgi:hypothetical protein